jgi:hypothetical protein
MKIPKHIIPVMLLAAAGLTVPARAQVAAAQDALRVANNWISLIIANRGSWGDSNTAVVQGVEDFKRGERPIGYFCCVWPKGYIIVSLRKELAPVKAYSATCDLDPALDEGMADLLKGCMERILDKIEQQAGPVMSARTQDVAGIVEIDYRDVWTALEGDVSTVINSVEPSDGDVGTMDYQEGDILLTTDWHQHDPYNRDCPAPPPGDDCTSARCVVGCVATAGAQIMRYWYWPPYGVGTPYSDTYDWPNMPDTVTGGSPAAEIAAVAEISHEIGIAVNMDYCGGNGCASGANTYDMEDVYEDQYRYATACVRRNRSSYSAVDWFNRIKAQCNVNRPVQYRIPGHSIVGDGWQEIYPGPVREYHMNYGWGGTGDDTWYTLDALQGGDPDNEYMLENIYPAQALGSSLITGTYSKGSFPYRYFDRDSTGMATIFASGQYLQFLPGIVVTSVGSITFDGSSTDNTRLFTRGDSSRGIRIREGSIVMFAGGGITFE